MTRRQSYHPLPSLPQGTGLWKGPDGFDLRLYLPPLWTTGSAVSPGQACSLEPLTAGNTSQPLPDSSAHQDPAHSKFPSGTCSVSPKGENGQTHGYAHLQAWRTETRRKAERAGSLGFIHGESSPSPGPPQTSGLNYGKPEAQSSPSTKETGICQPEQRGSFSR